MKHKCMFKLLESQHLSQEIKHYQHSRHTLHPPNHTLFPHNSPDLFMWTLNFYVFLYFGSFSIGFIFYWGGERKRKGGGEGERILSRLMPSMGSNVGLDLATQRS